MNNEIIIFEDQDIKLEVNMKDDTVWLNVHQLAILFDRYEKTIRKHINNALKEELDLVSTVANYATVDKSFLSDSLVAKFATSALFIFTF